jgi:hypothetical protein
MLAEKSQTKFQKKIIIDLDQTFGNEILIFFC